MEWFRTLVNNEIKITIAAVWWYIENNLSLQALLFLGYVKLACR